MSRVFAPAPIMWEDKGGYVGMIDVRSYPSGEPRVTFPLMNAHIRRILVRPASMLEFMAAMFFVDAYAERGHETPELILPFVPGARQDRMNDEGDYLFTAKSIAKEINARRFPMVAVLDPHSEVIAGLIDRCSVVHAAHCYASRVAPVDDEKVRYAAVVSPDAGGEKRAAGVAKLLGVPLVHAWKSRDVATGAITGFGMEASALAGANVLVVDDICDGGGTFLGLSRVLREHLIRADLYVTHGLFSKGIAPLKTCYSKITCTDSVAASVDLPGLDVIPVCERLLLKGWL